MFILTLSGLAIALGYAALQRAGVTADWNWSLCAIGLVCALHYGLPKAEPHIRPNRATTSLLAAFLTLTVLQVIPLPLSFAAALSPTRGELERAAVAGLGFAPRWTTLSVAPAVTRQYLLTIAGYALVFLLVRELALYFHQRNWSWAPVWPLLIVAAAEGALGFYQTYGGNTEAMARGTYVNRDHYAGLLELVLPFAVLYPVAILFRDRKRHESPAGPALQACGVLAFAAAILIGIVLSLSRMAFIAALSSLFVAGALALGLRDSQVDPVVKVSILRKWLPIALVGAVLVLGFVFLPSDPLIARFSDLAAGENITADTRVQIWRDTVKLVRAFPVFGSGLGTYESAFLRYKTVAPMFTVDFAHNDYLQVLAEMGAIGFATGLALVLLVLQSSIRGAVYARSLDERLLSTACIASLTAILLHSFVDFNMYVPANGLVVAWVAGIAAVRLEAKRSRASYRTETIQVREPVPALPPV